LDQAFQLPLVRDGEKIERGRQSPALLLQLSPKPVPVLDMLQLTLIEVVEKLARFRRVGPKPREVRDPIFLLGNMPLAQGDLPFSFFQVLKTHRPIHDWDIPIRDGI
jgi:hypothetical protein